MSIDVVAEVPDKLINEWRPLQRQADALAVPDSVFELLYGGAAGGGKTDYLLMLPIIRRYYTHPLFHAILFRRTFPQLEESIINRASRDDRYGSLVSGGYAKYNATDHCYTFRSAGGDFNGAKIRFGYMDQDSDARKHKSSEFNYVGMDEASEFTPYMLAYISTRIRTTTKDLPAMYRMGSNPGGPAHAYLRDRFIKPAPNGYTLLYDKTTKQKRIFIPAKASDNEHLAAEDPNYYNRLAILKSTNVAEYKALAEGDWFTFSGQVFTEFRDIHLPGEPDNALHVVPPFNIPDWWPKVLSIDWGYDANIVCHIAAITPDDRAVIFYEYVNRMVNVSTWAADIGRAVQFIKNLKQPCEMDPSGFANRGEDKTIAELAAKYSGLKFRRAMNDRIQGKILLHEYLRWRNKPARYVPQEGYDRDAAERILRMQGMKAYEDYLRLFQPEPPEKNIPKLLIFNTCTNLIETIKNCQYEDKTKNGKSTEDVREFDGDDSYDNVRYLLMGTHRYYEECGMEDDKRRQMAEAVEKLTTDNDYNAYAERLRNIEVNSKAPKPVMRRRGNSASRFH